MHSSGKAQYRFPHFFQLLHLSRFGHELFCSTGSVIPHTNRKENALVVPSFVSD